MFCWIWEILIGIVEINWIGDLGVLDEEGFIF